MSKRTRVTIEERVKIIQEYIKGAAGWRESVKRAKTSEGRFYTYQVFPPWFSISIHCCKFCCCRDLPDWVPCGEYSAIRPPLVRPHETV